MKPTQALERQHACDRQGSRAPIGRPLKASPHKSAALLLAWACLQFGAGPGLAGEIEVLHWWTSGGEARAAQALKASMQAKGHSWKDFAVAGSGGDSAITVLKSRVVSGNAPAAAQIKGPSLQAWANEGVLASINDVAKAERWDELLPKVVSEQMKYRGDYIAVPVNVHRVNWLWVNPVVFARTGAKVPSNWDEFFAAAETLKKAGVIALAHGGQSWQDLTLFETVALGVGGPEFYQQALVQRDLEALSGPTMEKVLSTYKRIKPYTDKNAPGRDWNLATAMVIRGEAGMQLMGDWAKGEFLAAGSLPGKGFICAPAPSTSKAFIFVIDSFAMFKLKTAANTAAQKDLASAVMSPEFQEVFNLNKGSIPVRMGMKMDKFDDCAKASAQEFTAAAKSASLLPSVANGMAVTSPIEWALKDAVSQFWNSDKMSSAEAIKRIVAAAKSR
ncbi:ABC transporter substrate-binding protein [Paucibacter sp. Y2R2-4]|uniref:ABC transporter substrate-binding protein n=1 Tax=Paucibacter sp. Y2R2-4 TaxID=2893553 RepID=UPI0021E3B080|nr:ABC transporter substrate-binding protein [Paucibacter sp. Y2R2-4]MCV2352514.1 ABC transporter substrate-binding protein [Paucibacter sp. Y2R2-4]